MNPSKLSAFNVLTFQRFNAIFACGAVLFLAFAASAQSYSINWYKIAGGGGASSGGQYSLSGTIGQPDASTAMTGGNYSLSGGFWAFISVVQTAGAPTLYISQSGKTVTVYWQNVSGWTLQQNNSLTVPTGWTLNSSWTTSNGTNYLNLTSPSGNLFFRLANP
ncbi:MAG TPA: hypothetical protein VGV18_04270 [Verrucomicrobiae bacterium]|nr:hypothetical protein [Verrucomicrobiae bacterium]